MTPRGFSSVEWFGTYPWLQGRRKGWVGTHGLRGTSKSSRIPSGTSTCPLFSSQRSRCPTGRDSLRYISEYPNLDPRVSPKSTGPGFLERVGLSSKELGTDPTGDTDLGSPPTYIYNRSVPWRWGLLPLFTLPIPRHHLILLQPRRNNYVPNTYPCSTPSPPVLYNPLRYLGGPVAGDTPPPLHTRCPHTPHHPPHRDPGSSRVGYPPVTVSEMVVGPRLGTHPLVRPRHLLGRSRTEEKRGRCEGRRNPRSFPGETNCRLLITRTSHTRRVPRIWDSEWDHRRSDKEVESMTGSSKMSPPRSFPRSRCPGSKETLTSPRTRTPSPPRTGVERS